MKPAPWAWTPALVAPEWQWALKDLVLAFHLSEGGGSTVFDVVHRESHPAAGTWDRDERGISFKVDASTDNINLGAPSYLEIVDPLTFIYAGDLTLRGTTRHAAGFFDQSSPFTGWGASIRNATDRMEFWDGSGFVTAPAAPLSAGFQVLGYTHNSTTLEFYRDGINVASPSVGALTAFTGGTKRLLGRSDDAASLRAEASILYLWERALTDTEHAQIARDPYGPLRMRDDVGVVITVAEAVAAGFILPWVRRRRR